ncbi:MAG TPA: hypothetical protein VEY91_06755 [Candidatus Limnocylindria bacterium]|nr:hypothetical protein [Candidatus Limnocylindria bacterium]
MLRSRTAWHAALGTGLLLAALGAPAAAAPAKNLLLNPGFETARSHPWMPAAWDTFQSGLPTVFFGRDTVAVHGGRYAVSVANVSNRIPMWHNWSQILVVGQEAWGKDLVFSVWTRSTGVQGRGYLLVQAYRDTIEKMARHWGIEREAASERMGISKLDDPFQNLGWKREYFSETETEWTRREVRVFCPPRANIVYLRAGLFGTGQVMFDDASLTLEPARPPDPVATGVNLLADPGFEDDGDGWEYSMPPYEGMTIARDTSVARSGAASVRFESGSEGMVEARTGVCQVISNRSLAGKRMRVRGNVKTDSLAGVAYIIVYASTASGDVRESTPREIGGTVDWTAITHEFDVPPRTYQVWAWFLYDAPVRGRLYWDDVSLELVGAAKSEGTKPMRPLPDR